MNHGGTTDCHTRKPLVIITLASCFQGRSQVKMTSASGQLVSWWLLVFTVKRRCEPELYPVWRDVDTGFIRDAFRFYISLLAIKRLHPTMNAFNSNTSGGPLPLPPFAIDTTTKDHIAVVYIGCVASSVCTQSTSSCSFNCISRLGILRSGYGSYVYQFLMWYKCGE